MWTPAELLNLVWTQVWQVTLVAVLVALLSYLLKTRCWHPSLGNWLWLLVLAKALTPPLWASPFGVFSWSHHQATLRGATNSGITQSADVTGAYANWPGVLLGLIVAVWAIGFARVLVSQLLRWRQLKRLIADTSVPADETIARKSSSLAKKLGFRRTPEIAISSDEIGPALVGIWNPTIVMPNSLIKDSSWDELEPIVAHELLHLRRRDTVISGLQLIASAIWWFHPLIHWAGKQIEEASERCVDLAVLHTAGCDPKTYCNTLLRLLESRAEDNHCLLLAAPAVRGVSATCERVRELTTVPAKPAVWKKVTSLTFCLCLALVVLPGQPVESMGHKCYSADDLPVHGDSIEARILSLFYVDYSCSSSED